MIGILLTLALPMAQVPAPTTPPTPLSATPPTAAPAAAKFDLDTPIEQIVADPAAKAVLDKHLPGMSGNDNFEMFKVMSLNSLSQMSDKIPADKLAAVKTDLARIK